MLLNKIYMFSKFCRIFSSNGNFSTFSMYNIEERNVDGEEDDEDVKYYEKMFSSESDEELPEPYDDMNPHIEPDFYDEPEIVEDQINCINYYQERYYRNKPMITTIWEESDEEMYEDESKEGELEIKDKEKTFEEKTCLSPGNSTSGLADYFVDRLTCADLPIEQPKLLNNRKIQQNFVVLHSLANNFVNDKVESTKFHTSPVKREPLGIYQSKSGFYTELEDERREKFYNTSEHEQRVYNGIDRNEFLRSDEEKYINTPTAPCESSYYTTETAECQKNIKENFEKSDYNSKPNSIEEDTYNGLNWNELLESDKEKSRKIAIASCKSSDTKVTIGCLRNVEKKFEKSDPNLKNSYSNEQNTPLFSNFEKKEKLKTFKLNSHLDNDSYQISLGVVQESSIEETYLVKFFEPELPIIANANRVYVTKDLISAESNQIVVFNDSVFATAQNEQESYSGNLKQHHFPILNENDEIAVLCAPSITELEDLENKDEKENIKNKSISDFSPELSDKDNLLIISESLNEDQFCTNEILLEQNDPEMIKENCQDEDEKEYISANPIVTNTVVPIVELNKLNGKKDVIERNCIETKDFLRKAEHSEIKVKISIDIFFPQKRNYKNNPKARKIASKLKKLRKNNSSLRTDSLNSKLKAKLTKKKFLHSDNSTASDLDEKLQSHVSQIKIDEKILNKILISNQTKKHYFYVIPVVCRSKKGQRNKKKISFVNNIAGLDALKSTENICEQRHKIFHDTLVAMRFKKNTTSKNLSFQNNVESNSKLPKKIEEEKKDIDKSEKNKEKLYLLILMVLLAIFIVFFSSLAIILQLSRNKRYLKD